MTSLTIAWEYLTGYAVATDPNDRERAEWPPHPARVFMALAAAHFETGQDEAEARALQWLESLPSPDLRLPDSRHVFERSCPTVFVPVNDKAGPARMGLQCLPSVTRAKQPRTFPKVWLGNGCCALRWERTDDSPERRAALNRLCSKVTRIGHSSSLVRMWVEGAPANEKETDAEPLVLRPCAELPGQSLRIMAEGMLSHLKTIYNEEGRARGWELADRKALLELERKSVRGKGAKGRKQAIDEQILCVEQEMADTDDRAPLRPVVSSWESYSPKDVWSPAEAQHGVFDPDMVLLAQEGGARLGLESTLLLTGALRGAILKKVDSEVQNGHRDEIPSWISGHAASGRPVRDQGAHLSLTPLAHVSHPHADGRVLGLALLLPAWLEAEQRSVLRPVLFDEEGRPERITLRMGRVGTATFRQIPIFGETRRALTPETWNAFPSGSTSWASVTPVVLDRFPKRNRRTDRQAWEEEVADVLRTSCESVGLPTPCRVRISTTSLHLGVPRAIPKRRRLRGGSGGSEAQLGTGFPAYPMKGTNASRPQVHVGLEFDEPVLGPMVLGAGRYRGYGFFKPLTGGENRI